MSHRRQGVKCTGLQLRGVFPAVATDVAGNMFPLELAHIMSSLFYIINPFNCRPHLCSGAGQACVCVGCVKFFLSVFMSACSSEQIFQIKKKKMLVNSNSTAPHNLTLDQRIRLM